MKLEPKSGVLSDFLSKFAKKALKTPRKVTHFRENPTHFSKKAINFFKKAVHLPKKAVHFFKKAVHLPKKAVHLPKKAVHFCSSVMPDAVVDAAAESGVALRFPPQSKTGGGETAGAGFSFGPRRWYQVATAEAALGQRPLRISWRASFSGR